MKNLLRVLSILQGIQQEVLRNYPESTCCIDSRTLRDGERTIEVYINLSAYRYTAYLLSEKQSFEDMMRKISEIEKFIEG